MRIKFKKTPEQVELLKATVQKNEIQAREAQWAFAELMQPVLDKIILQADTTAGLFERFSFNEDDDPSLPLDAFNTYRDNTLSIWSQEVAGGLPTNHVTSPIKEVKFTTYRLDSAISWEKKFSRKSRLDIVGGYMTMLAQELLLKIRNNAWATVFTALANASHSINGTATNHVFRATTTDTFNMDELNHWLTLIRRLGQSWANGTAIGSNGGYGLTDLYCSPEFIQKIRALSYNPINTLGANNTTGTANSGVVTLSEDARRQLFNTAGIQNFLGVNLNEMQEFGTGYPFNTLFDAAAGSTSYLNRAGGGGAAFNGATEEIVVGVNAAAETWAFRPVEENGQDDPAVGTGDTLSLTPDDQFLARSGRTGMFGAMQLGHLITSDRPLTGFII